MILKLQKIYIKMDRYEFLIIIWDITERYSHHISTELLTITIADRYVEKGHCYDKALAYVTSIIAAKINEEGHGLRSIKTAACITGNKHVYTMEHDILNTIDLSNNFITQLCHVFIVLNVKLSIYMIRYLEWCHVLQYNFFTIVLAIKLMIKCKQFPILHSMKFYKVYTIFHDLSALYDIDINELITLYNKKID
jgi:hypothetical protein